MCNCICAQRGMNIQISVDYPVAKFYSNINSIVKAKNLTLEIDSTISYFNKSNQKREVISVYQLHSLKVKTGNNSFIGALVGGGLMLYPAISILTDYNSFNNFDPLILSGSILIGGILLGGVTGLFIPKWTNVILPKVRENKYSIIVYPTIQQFNAFTVNLSCHF